ncbi:hypothetical protein [Cardinium endosymbiont of Oedothorax gibbosus]|uniref:hypothetical protein n=1 Tax=Cardinium endosymbiont of Oedothorax gibbosus TaxID=931101 RepID=UPI002024DF01|nr:hypothetical protein [Cardinium endosymbiont of Oedothorax gibbosus]
MQDFINNRFRRYLTHRRKGRGCGWQSCPNSKLYTMGMLYIGSGMIKYPERVVQGL